MLDFTIGHRYTSLQGFPCSSAGKESTCNAGDPSSIPGSRRSPGERINYPLQYSWATLVAHPVKKLPAMQETWVWSLDWDNPLEEGMATHSSSCLENSHGQEEPGCLQSMGSQRVEHDWVMKHRTAHFFTAQFSSVTQSCLILCDPMNCSRPGLPVHQQTQSLPKPMSIESVMPSNHFILCHALLLLLSIFPITRVFSNESALCIRWPKYWCFSFSISPSNEHPGLISFRMDCLDLLAVQGTLKSLLQHHSSKASILWCSTFFIVQLSHPYMTSGKTIALTRRTFVDKVMSLLYNTFLQVDS